MKNWLPFVAGPELLHREQTSSIMLYSQTVRFIKELVALEDALTACAVAFGEVSSLQHELRDQPVTRAARISQLLVLHGHTVSILPRAQSPEVLYRERTPIAVQLEDKTTGGLTRPESRRPRRFQNRCRSSSRRRRRRRFRHQVRVGRWR